jgi:WD repeat-containing protein 48
VKEKVDFIEQAERRKEAELQLVGENELPSGPDFPRSSPSKSIKIATRSSHDALPGSPKPAAGKVLASTLPQTSTQGTRNRPTSTSSVRSAGSGHQGGVRHRKASRATIEEARTEKRPEDLYELMCDDIPIPNEMTLAAVKKFKWKGGGELVMEYRRKRTRA